MKGLFGHFQRGMLTNGLLPVEMLEMGACCWQSTGGDLARRRQSCWLCSQLQEHGQVAAGICPV